MAYIKGVWKWNDVVYCESRTHEWYRITFTSNGVQFTGILGEWGTGYHYLSYCEGENYSGKQTLVGASIAEGDDFFSVKEAYRIMVFGEEQNIDDELYEFISANAHELTEAEKLLMIAENEQKVYNSGRSEGYNAGHSVGYVEGETAGFDAGKQAEREAFWDAYIPKNITNWQYAFYSARWGDENFYPTKDLKPTGALSFGFSGHLVTNLKQRLIDCGVTLDTSGVTSGNYMFCFCYNTTHLPTISLVGLTSSVSYMFADNRIMVEVEKIILKEDGSTTFDYWFRECNALTTIAFEGVIGQNIDFSACTKLSKASITNIINHLSDTATGKTLTLSKTAVDTAWAWEDWDGSMRPGSTDGLWLELRDSKSNWTITLV